jgi:ribosomal protein S12 methylthiotransferase accessory factor
VLIGNAAGDDPVDVTVRARGELLERMSNVLAGRAAETAGAVVATFEQLRRRRAPAIDPVHWGGPQAREVCQLWVAGRSLLTGAEALVPAGVAFLHHRPPTGCQAGTRVGSTGVAAHPDAMAAASHAAWEILERDVVRRSWYGGGGPAPTVVSADLGLPADLAELLDHLGLRMTVLRIPTPVTVGCIVTCLCDRDGHGQSFGARCRPLRDQRQSIEKAAYEALMVRWSMSTPVARDTWLQWAGSTLPRTAVEHALWAFHRQDSLRMWLDKPDPAGGLPVSRTQPGQPAASWTPAQLLGAYTGQDVIAVDTTVAQAHAEGFAVVRVVAPGAYPLPTGSRSNISGPPHPFG